MERKKKLPGVSFNSMNLKRNNNHMCKIKRRMCEHNEFSLSSAVIENRDRTTADITVPPEVMKFSVIAKNWIVSTFSTD